MRSWAEDMLGGCLGLAGKWMRIAAKQAKTNPASKYIKMLIRFLMNWLCPGSKIGQSVRSTLVWTFNRFNIPKIR